MIDKNLLAERKSACEKRAESLPALSEAQNKPEGVCAVDWSLQLARKCRAEACGKSVPCRDGMWQLVALLEKLTTGKAGGEEILETIRDVLDMIVITGCPFTSGCAERILASMNAYADEWDAHVRSKCPQQVCAAYYTLYIDPAVCTGCGECAKLGGSAVDGGEGLIHIIRDDSDLKTGEFIGCCPVGAIKKFSGLVKPRLPEVPVPAGSFEGGEAGGRRRRRRG